MCSQDWERLYAAFQDMQAYWSRLEWKRKELELTGRHGVHSTLSQSIKNIQLDLRDLMNQVSRQVSTDFLLKSTHVLSLCLFTATWAEVTPRSDKKTASFFPPDEHHAELLGEAHLSYSMDALEPANHSENSLGQTSGRLRHTEGSRPLPHQAGERLPLAGFEDTHDSALKRERFDFDNKRAKRSRSRAHNLTQLEEWL